MFSCNSTKRSKYGQDDIADKTIKLTSRANKILLSTRTLNHSSSKTKNSGAKKGVKIKALYRNLVDRTVLWYPESVIWRCRIVLHYSMYCGPHTIEPRLMPHYVHLHLHHVQDFGSLQLHLRNVILPSCIVLIIKMFDIHPKEELRCSH